MANLSIGSLYAIIIPSAIVFCFLIALFFEGNSFSSSGVIIPNNISTGRGINKKHKYRKHKK